MVGVGITSTSPIPPVGISLLYIHSGCITMVTILNRHLQGRKVVRNSVHRIFRPVPPQVEKTVLHQASSHVGPHLAYKTLAPPVKMCLHADAPRLASMILANNSNRAVHEGSKLMKLLEAGDWSHVILRRSYFCEYQTLQMSHIKICIALFCSCAHGAEIVSVVLLKSGLFSACSEVVLILVQLQSP